MAAAADAAAIAAPYHRRHRLLRTAVVQLPVPVPGHLYNKRMPGQVPNGGNNNLNSHGSILYGAKDQRQPFLQRLPSRIRYDLTRAIEMAVSGTANPAQQQQQQQHQHAQAKQTSLKNKPNNRQANSKKQSEKA